MKSPNIDSLLNDLGKPGKLQCLSYLFLCMDLWIVMTYHMSSVFFVAKTGYSCKTSKNTSLIVSPTNEKEGINECFVGNSSEKCTSWNYNLPDGETTIISEFDLVCDDAYKSDLTTTIYFAGVMVGGIVFGIMADKYGRKRVIILTLLMSGMVSVATFFLRNYTAYIVLRFFLGFFVQGVQNSSYILALETLSPKYRSIGGLFYFTFGAVGVLLLIFLSYLIKDWKYVQLCTGLLPFFHVFSIWYIPDSVRWNITQHNFKQAEEIIKRIVKFNKLTFPQKLFEEIKNDALSCKDDIQNKQKGNFYDVFKNPKLRRITFLLFPLWFTFSAGFYGLAFHMSYLFGNKYLNFAISTIVDASISCNLLWIVPRFGRRRPLISCFLVCSVANAVCSVTASYAASSTLAKYFGTAMAIFGKTMIGFCFSIGYVYTSELYPTVVRNAGLGMNTFWTRVGGMAAPQIFFLETVTAKFVPYTILTALTMLCAFVIVLLPETKDKALTDRIEVSMISLCDQQDYLINKSDVEKKSTECHETSL